MSKLIRTLISLTMIMALVLALGAQAFAASTASSAEDLRLKPYSFPIDQYYENAPENIQVWTVQVAAGYSYQGAVDQANGLIAKGLDGFVYAENGMYYVMSGKFGSEYDALCYGELIHTDPKEAGAYMTGASLPKAAVQSFQSIFYGAVRTNQDPTAMETYWEEPSGAYLRADAEDTVEVYTVQFSRGTCFTRSEELRDRMERNGYPAFVYKENMIYHTMSGMFLDKSEAKEFSALLCCNTEEKDGVVKKALVPQSELEAFQAWWSEQK